MKVLAPLYVYQFTLEVEAELDKIGNDTIFCVAVSQHQESLVATYNVTPHLHRISCPTLVVVGRHDFVCPPSQAQILHEGIPNSQLIIFEKSGHFPMMEERHKFIQAVKDWLSQTKIEG